jgi:UPF0176 protein
LLQYHHPNMPQEYKVLLYYKYVEIEDPEKIRIMQRALCEHFDLKGRILISQEGINGTVAGLTAAVDEYIRETEKLPEFKEMEWKVSWADEQVFPKLKVVVRDEIVTLGEKKQGKDVSLENKAHYIEPEELLELYEKNEDFVILDARNLYEAEIGKFKNALVPPIDNFREFPEFAKTLEKYKDKNVVTYCTGGIRCEKASAYLREKGFEKVRQLHGGIHEYGQKAGGKYFEGEMFVFDKRLHMPVNTTNPTIISECKYCQKKVARYIDCVIESCPELFICCEECQQQYHSTCSDECRQKLSANAKTKSSVSQTMTLN